MSRIEYKVTRTLKNQVYFGSYEKKQLTDANSNMTQMLKLFKMLKRLL